MKPIVTLRAALFCAIANVKSIPTLRRLSIEEPSLTDADLASLASVIQLEELSFESLDLTDARVPQLQAFSFLKSITVVLRPKSYPLETQARVKAMLPIVKFFNSKSIRKFCFAFAVCLLSTGVRAQVPDLSLDYLPPHWLAIRGDHFPGKEIRINYLEAYCRAGSTDADWVQHTVIKHTPELISLSDDKKSLRLRDMVEDGVVVDHIIKATADEISFEIKAHNPTSEISQIHWAQPCIRLADFTGYDSKGKDINDYLPKCFLFVDGKLERMNSIVPWVKEARYTPGQVWCPKGVPRTDVNPRPLSSIVPSNGLIGCFSSDEKWIFAVAFEPYQELFQGVARCLHSDFRIGGLKPGETKNIHGKIYIVANNLSVFSARYEKDFPNHVGKN